MLDLSSSQAGIPPPSKRSVQAKTSTTLAGEALHFLPVSECSLGHLMPHMDGVQLLRGRALPEKLLGNWAWTDGWMEGRNNGLTV